MKEDKRRLFRRYSAHSTGLHCLYWPAYGSLLSFVTIMLLDRGFNNTQIGVLVALGSLLAVVVQQPVAAFADRSRRVELNHLVCIIAVLMVPLAFFLFLNIQVSLIVIGLCFLLLYAGTVMLQSMLNALGMEFLNRDYPVNYGRSRGTGCLFCAAGTFLLGKLGEDTGDGMLLLMAVALFFMGIVAVSFRMPPRLEQEENAPATQSKRSMLAIFSKYPFFMLLTIGVVLNQTSYNIGGLYLIHVVTPFGGGSAELGIAMAFSALAEFITMNLFSRIAKRVHFTKLMCFSVLMIPLKPITFALAQSVGYAYFAQFFHLFGIALFMPSSVYYINYIMRSEDRAQGQSIIVGATILAATMASVLGGWGVDAIGVTGTLWIGNVLALIGALFVLYAARKIEPHGVNRFVTAEETA